MDARKPVFLDGHVDPDAHRVEVTLDPVTSFSRGVLRGPATRCTFVASVACPDETLVIAPTAMFRIELDMFVAELDALDVQLARPGEGSLAALWIDEAVETPWRALVAGADPRCPADVLDVRAGTCVLASSLAADDRARMQHVVDVISALSSAPARRMGELAAALARFETRPLPARLRLGAEGIVIVAGGIEVVIDACLEAGTVLTRVHTANTRPTRLAIVDPALDRKLRPRAKLSSFEIEGRDWLASDSPPLAIRRFLDAAQPSSLVATEERVQVTFAGWVADASRLGAAAELVATLGGSAKN